MRALGMKWLSTNNLSPRGKRITLIAALILLSAALTFWAVRAVQTAHEFGWLYVVGTVVWDVIVFLLIGAMCFWLDR
jgi:hypothetical protein